MVGSDYLIINKLGYAFEDVYLGNGAEMSCSLQSKKIFRGANMETVIAAGLSAIAAIITCVINNNIQRVREQAAIERKIDSINANYDKQTALITQQIVSLTEHVNKHNNVVERLYDVEKLTVRLQDMVNELREDDRR